MPSLRAAGNWFSSKTKGHAAGASKETNKTIAKDPNMSIGTRIRAAGNTVRDSVEQAGHNSDAAVHKNVAKHSHRY